jgi:hypothetical protein
LRKASESSLQPYPAQYARSIDLVDKLSLQKTLGAGNFNVTYIRGEVSFQKEKLPQQVRSGGKLGDSKIILQPISRYLTQYEWGSIEPKEPDTKPQRELLADIASGLGLDDMAALSVSIKSRLLLHNISSLPKEVQDIKPLSGHDILYHYQAAAGDYTDIVVRSLRLPEFFLRSPVKTIRSELVDNKIVGKNDPILSRIRSVLRTIWITPKKGGWRTLLPAMPQLHMALTKPYWWQDTALPTGVKIENSTIPSLNAQIYHLHKRGLTTVIQLPREVV